MRIAIFSDIHGNLEALEAVLAAYATMKVDRYICLGDVVGYGAQPDECCTRVREVAALTVLGNHDAAVAGRMDYSYYYNAARHALDWCRARLSQDNMEWLQALPYQRDEQGFSIRYTHGSPVAPEEYSYVFALEQAREILPIRETLAEANFIGHSHLKKSFALGADDAHDIVAPRFGIREGHQYIITVGSVGQPRDHDPRACCGLYDTEARTYEYVQVDYDIESAAQKIFDAELALNFGKRLFFGI